MLSGQHSRNNTFSDLSKKNLKKKKKLIFKKPSPLHQVDTFCEQVLNRTQLMTRYSYRRFLTFQHRLVGLVERCPPRKRKIPGSNPACAGIFSGSSHTSDFKIGTPVAAHSDAWRYRVSVGTGRPGVSILSLGEVGRWICNLYLSVAARKIVCADPSLRYTRMLLGR